MDGEENFSDESLAQAKKSNTPVLRRVLIAAAILLILVIGLVGFYIVSRWQKINYIEIEPEDVVYNEDIDETYVEEIREGYWNIAILGVDNDWNSDVIIICSVNYGTGEIRLCSVYRDTIMQMEDGSYHKINGSINHSKKQTAGSSYTYKDMAMAAVNALNQNLDLEIEDFLMVDWTAVAIAVNLLGGVEVEVTDAMMEEINGYITNTVNALKVDGMGSFQLEKAGYQTLDGPQTVAYCRLRHMDSDLQRTERQRDVIKQLFQKAKGTDYATLSNIADEVFPYITTSIDLGEILSFATEINRYYFGEMSGFPFSQVSVQTWRRKGDWAMFATDLAGNVSELHDFLYDTVDYVPSESVKKISERLDEESGLYEEEETTESEEE